MKIGIDIHGVADEQKEFFAELTHLLVKGGHEVHIITGPRISETLSRETIELGLAWTHLFSITDYHIQQGTKMEFDANGDPHMDSYLWDRTKADYCLREGIDLMFDDSDAYNYFFKTPYARYYSKNKRKHYTRQYHKPGIRGVKATQVIIDEIPQPPPLPKMCKFAIAWMGLCNKRTENQASFCLEHEKQKCCVCGRQAVETCSVALQLVCGAPLCEGCTHDYEGHGHVRRSQK